jgi:antitoxin HicB
MTNRVKVGTKKPRRAGDLSTLDDFLKEEGVFDEFQARAIKEVLAWQLEAAMKNKNMSRKRLAEVMGTSRSQISRLLDPENGNVTLTTLQRAAEMVGRKVRLELV